MADLGWWHEREGPYEIDNIAHAGFPTILVLDGGGYSTGARQWLLAHSRNPNLVDVCSHGHISTMQGATEDMK